MPVLCLFFCNVKQVRENIRIVNHDGIVKLNTRSVSGYNTVLNRDDLIETGDNSDCDII